MKKSKLLKITLSIVLMAFMSVNVLGQELNSGSGDPADNLPNLAEDDDGTSVDHVTEGYLVPYYVTPDPILNSGYSEPYVIGTADQGFSSGWNWTVNTNNTEDGGSAGGSANATIHNGGYDGSAEYGYNHPYVEVEWSRSGGATAGSGEQAYIEVQETGQTGGSCNGSWNWLSVQVYAAPQFTFIDGTNGGTDQETADASGVIELCDDGTGITRDIVIANIPNNGIPMNGNFKFRLDRDVNTIDQNGNLVGSGNPQSESIDEVVSVPLSFGNSIVLYSGLDLSAIDATTDGENNPNITRYRFDFGTTIDNLGTTNNGITDPVQRKSQYLTNPDANDADWDYIANTGGNGDMLTIITYPAPNTGNIHYVPNDFDL